MTSRLRFPKGDSQSLRKAAPWYSKIVPSVVWLSSPTSLRVNRDGRLQRKWFARLEWSIVGDLRRFSVARTITSVLSEEKSQFVARQWSASASMSLSNSRVRRTEKSVCLLQFSTTCLIMQPWPASCKCRKDPVVEICFCLLRANPCHGFLSVSSARISASDQPAAARNTRASFKFGAKPAAIRITASSW